MANVQTSGVGLKLREARERRGVSLRQIANTTRISIVALEALERNDIAKLPGGIFSRAFVRSYALEVGLDAEETIREFIAQFPQDSVTAGHPMSAAVDADLNDDSGGRGSAPYLRLLLIGVPIALVIVYLGTMAWSRAAVPPPSTTAIPVPAPVVSNTAPAPPALDNSSASDDVATTGGVLAAGAGDPVLAPDIQATRSEAESTSAHLVVELVASGPCRVTASVDGDPVINRVLRSGDRRSFDAQRTLVLTVSDPAAVSMTLNGAGARPLGKSGERTTTTLTPANFRQYLMTP